MIKLILWLLWPAKLHDAEFNIEGLEVKAIERDGKNTYISHKKPNGEWEGYFLPCNLECHQRLIERFRIKIENQKQANK